MDPQVLRIQITAVTRGADGQLLYALETDRIGGLLTFDPGAGRERRLFHRENFRVSDLDRHPELPLTACSVPLPNGGANLATISDASPHLVEVTEGDSLDEAPSWIPGVDRQLVFQSAGLSRNAEGLCTGVGAGAIHKLDLVSGELTTLLEDSRNDLLLPHLNRRGDLLFLRRPYEATRSRAGLVWLVDTVMFPLRLTHAVIQFLNFFSMTFAKKPLLTAGGPKTQGPTLQSVMLRGRMIDAQRALRQASKGEATPPLVPKSWQLVRRSPTGEETVLATHVVAFDLLSDDRILFTNGRGVFLSNGQDQHLVHQDRLVQNVLALG